MMVSIPEIKNESDTYFMDPKKLRAKCIRIMMFVDTTFISIFIILSAYLLRLTPPNRFFLNPMVISPFQIQYEA